ncbi:uncharacterized protein METZ01_LOCUS425337, partial [marine metagenome]
KITSGYIGKLKNNAIKYFLTKSYWKKDLLRVLFPIAN